MLEALGEWMGFPMYYVYDGQDAPQRAGASHATIYPYGPFEAANGKSVMLGLQNEREWKSFCAEVLRRRELAESFVFVSSLAIWDIVEREHPEYIPVLKAGFKIWCYDEINPGQEPFTPPVPVFGEVDGIRSVFWAFTTDVTAKYLKEPLTQLQRNCLRFIYEVQDRKELHLRMQLERGEAVFFNNLEVLHSRTSFVQWEDPAKPRLLLRLWFHSTPPRPIPREMMWRKNPSGLLGHDPDPRYKGQVFVQRDDSPSSQFVHAYFDDAYRGKMSPSQLVRGYLEELP